MVFNGKQFQATQPGSRPHASGAGWRLQPPAPFPRRHPRTRGPQSLPRFWARCSFDRRQDSERGPRHAARKTPARHIPGALRLPGGLAVIDIGASRLHCQPPVAGDRRTKSMTSSLPSEPIRNIFLRIPRIVSMSEVREIPGRRKKP